MKKETKIITIRIPMQWYQDLCKLADIECRTINSLGMQAIKEFIKRRKKDEGNIKQAD